MVRRVDLGTVWDHTGISSPHHPMASSTFPELLSACTDPNNGTIRWSTACQTAKDHGVWEDFCTEYGTKPFRVDTGELLTWLGY